MDKLKNNLEKLKVLSCCGKKNRIKILKNGDENLILCVCECILNTLNGNIQYPPKIFKKLKSVKYILRKINKLKNINDKKKILIQKGGFLQYLLPAAITVITSLIENFQK
jgi:hypothetical protein